MTRWPSLIGALILLISPLMSHAQVATVVRSGEHEDFSRLVFADTGPQTWRILTTSAGRNRVEFQTELPILDLSQVFQRIPKTRLSVIEQDGNALELDLNCDCPIAVSQLTSGHIVLDIQDPDPGARPAQQARTLPTILPVRPILLRPLPMPAEPMAGPRLSRTDSGAPGQDPRRHVAIRETSRGLTSDRPDTFPSLMNCGFEGVARDHLLSDPMEALASLAHRRLAATDETGRLLEPGVRDLAHLYLDLGWGQEALLVLRQATDRDPHRTALARLFDGTLLPTGTAPDAACGPASSLAAILAGLDPQTIRQVDGRSLANFVTDMPQGHASNLRPRLIEALEAADAGDALAFLRALDPADEPLGDIAGTDTKTASAIVGSLLDHEGYPSDLPETLLINALAFRQSMPPDAARANLDRALASGLAASGYVVEAMQVATDGAVSSEDILEQVLDHLPAGQAAAAAMRLRGDLDLTHPAAQRAAA
ncbi:MAG: hypothetical protein AAGE03_14605, partial [Pseudomonadota bacterium]